MELINANWPNSKIGIHIKLIPAKNRKFSQKEIQVTNKQTVSKGPNSRKLIRAKCPKSLVRMAVFPVSFLRFPKI